MENEIQPASGKRSAPSNCQVEPPYPDHRTVTFSIRAPQMTAHAASEKCATEEPHEIATCGEFQDCIFAIPGVSGEAQPPRIDCDSEEGVTIGLIDSIISCANSLKGRQMNTPAILAALRDMGSNTTLRELFVKGLGFDYKKLRRAYETDALERAMERKMR